VDFSKLANIEDNGPAGRLRREPEKDVSSQELMEALKTPLMRQKEKGLADQVVDGDFDESEFQAAMAPTFSGAAAPTKNADAGKSQQQAPKKKRSSGKLQLNVALVQPAAATAKGGSRTVVADDEDAELDLWIKHPSKPVEPIIEIESVPALPAGTEHKAKEEAARLAKEESDRKAKEEEAARKAKAEADRKAKEEETARKAKEEADRKAEAARLAKAEADKAGATDDRDSKKKQVSLKSEAAATPAADGDDDAGAANEPPFDKKAYNAAVRRAKALAAENDLAGALVEYQRALAVRPGHEGVAKKIKSLQKKVGGK